MKMPEKIPFVVSEEVATAVREGRGVVSLETTIVVHGLPAPANLEVALQCEQAVRSGGSVPATIGVLNGKVIVGLSMSELEQLADPSRNASKLSTRDIGIAIARSLDGATTVAGTIAISNRAGISVMATGGLGGVHRDALTSFDESADLTALSRTPVLVVASGVKSILDIPATLERLDSLGVPVIGYRTNKFPGFYRSESGYGLDWSIQSAEEAAAAFAAHRIFSSSGFLLANPVETSKQLDGELHDRALASALAKAEKIGVTGKEVTPVLLAEFANFTSGVSVQVNRDLVVSNAALGGHVATSLASRK
jgi:pseudouridine-5'-phosphate glycosidase